ncbi:coiled-coil domain-containing protein [Nonomuraea fuscirosea]|uniref:coiled-coil domain-containing protein n=1 Tax=Nonomuraea fuscirosea TaxID=1291556 RepID=UPI0033FC97E9
MSIKDATIEELGVEFATKVHNEFVQTRTDQIMMGEDLTRRINGVANQVKSLNGTVQKLDARVGRLESKVDRLDARVGSLETKVDQLEAKVDARFEQVDARFDKVDGQISSLQKGQVDMMNILIAIQRKLDAN